MIACKVEINTILDGDAYVFTPESDFFPLALKQILDPPKKLYLIGNPYALTEGIAIVGARKASPYGVSCTKHFASIAAKQGIVVISGGAYGCDSAAHRAALDNKSKTIVFLGGGCNVVYPQKNRKMYQEIINTGGAIVSENPWNYQPLKHTFLNRNRLIAGLAKATLITEASLPSGTFSTADFALKYNKDVLAVPGAITNPGSAGCNYLIYQGAFPVINDEVFYDYLYRTFSCIKPNDLNKCLNKQKKIKSNNSISKNPIEKALLAQPMSIEDLYQIALKHSKAKDPSIWLSQKLIDAQNSGKVTRYSNGLYGPVLHIQN